MILNLERLKEYKNILKSIYFYNKVAGQNIKTQK